MLEGNIKNKFSPDFRCTHRCTCVYGCYAPENDTLTDITYQTFCCVVSLSTFMSCAVFWQAHKASQNTNNE